MAIKTAEQVRAEFARKGISVAEWSKAHGLSQFLVYQLLSGRAKGRRGEAHRAAVLLGLKEGDAKRMPLNPAHRVRAVRDALAA